MIELKDIHKSYYVAGQEHKVLRNINLSLSKGETLAIIGPSGSGKSTLLNILGLLDIPTAGEYYLDGKDTSSFEQESRATLRNQSLGFVFQTFLLLPRMTALQNVCLPLMYRSMENAEAEKKALAMLAEVGMDKYATHLPNQLSGGQRQRVAIARALVCQPSILLADEPTGALDSKTGQEIMELFLRLNEKHQTTLIVVTHDPMVAKYCQRTIQLDDGKIKGREAQHEMA